MSIVELFCTGLEELQNYVHLYSIQCTASVLDIYSVI